MLTDTTNGAILATVTLDATTAPVTGNAAAYATVTVPGHVLASGANTVTATYAGDPNYTGSSSTTSVIYTPAFTLTLPGSSLLLTPGSTTGNSMTVVVTPAPGTALNPSNLIFTCPGNLPSGVTCVFSTPVAGANGTVTSVLTLVLSSPLAMLEHSPRSWLGAGLATSFAGLGFLWVPRRRRSRQCLLTAVSLSMFFGILGCAGGSRTPTANASATQTQLTASTATPSIGSNLTLSASVAPIVGTGVPTGTVTFMDGANILGTAQLAAGKATLSTPALTIGNHVITADYSGDSTFNGSNSSTSAIDVTLNSTISVMVQDGTGNSAQQALTLTVH